MLKMRIWLTGKGWLLCIVAATVAAVGAFHGAHFRSDGFFDG